MAILLVSVLAAETALGILMDIAKASEQVRVHDLLL